MPRSTARATLLAACLPALLLLAGCDGRQPARPRAAARTERAPIHARTIASALPPAFGPIDGVAVAAPVPVPIAVMVDNVPAARPQYGLAQAEVVYELLVEYGITRLLAVYSYSDAPRIEPVRSARTPFLLLVQELAALYVHVGAAAEAGPADADGQMRAWGIRHVEESEGGPIGRDPGRPPPHNAITSIAALRAHARAQGWDGPATVVSWRFKADGGSGGAPAVSAETDFADTSMNGGAFTVRWQHDPTTNSYRRWQGGEPHTDAATGRQLEAKNVIFQVVPVMATGDRSGHVLYQMEGSGRAVVLIDGRAVECTWRKDGFQARTRYYDGSGNEIAFNRGATWVELIPLEAPLRLV